ncbi:MAG TPA: ABC transporter ATP-binding protein [Nocardioides sp.]|uniref:ABC transporter ATP-binding protein n=1 Tax=Nocardioides sp. TaxID=35761 RepID=UPI002F3F0DE2
MTVFEDERLAASHEDSAGSLPAAVPSMTRVVKHGYHAEPKLLWASLAMTALEALPDVLVGIWLALVTDGLVHHHQTRLYVGAGGLAASATLMWVLSVTLDRTTRRLGDRLNIFFQGHVARLQAEVATVEHHERPVYLDRIAVLRTGVFALDHLFRSMFTMLGWLLRLAFVCVLLAAIHPALLLLLLGAVPLLLVAVWRPKIEKRVEERVASHGRLGRHLFTVATTPPPGKEVRVTGNQSDLVRRRRTAWEAWFGPIRATNLASAAWLSLAWAVFSLAFVAAVVWVVTGLDRGPGAVVLVLTAGGRLSAYVGSAVGELGFLRGIWLDSAQRLAWLEDFAAEQNAHVDQATPERLSEGIRFEGVSFAYPGTTREVLRDVDLALPAGRVVAVVGENGAGKSTLVKLLARMYAPTSGRITADGVDIGRIDVEQWRERLAGAFQDFARLEFVARTTVGLGDEPRQDDRVAVGSAVERAGATPVVEGLREGLDTQLGPSWESGVDVSFGQWQKLALARGYMRPEPLLLMLDEPTAALDAETEHALFERFAAGAREEAADGRVTVLVSHRFSTVRMADLIVVLDGARVTEVGSHDELMARGGTYADLYSIQASSYA